MGATEPNRTRPTRPRPPHQRRRQAQGNKATRRALAKQTRTPVLPADSRRRVSAGGTAVTFYELRDILELSAVEAAHSKDATDEASAECGAQSTSVYPAVREGDSSRQGEADDAVARVVGEPECAGTGGEPWP